MGFLFYLFVPIRMLFDKSRWLFFSIETQDTMKRKKNETYYLHNAEMFDEWKHWKETGQMTERMGQMMLTLARHIMTTRSFSGYKESMKEDMISDGILKIV